MKTRRASLVPAAARTRAASGQEAILAANAVDTFTEVLGGKDAVIAALAVASADPEVDRLLGLLGDPEYARWNVGRLCHLAGITPADLYAALGKASIAKAKIEAIVTEVAPRLRGVVKDVMTRAQPYEIACTACGGLGTTTAEPTAKEKNPSPEPCVTCRGGGVLLALPDLDRQKLALELGQLVSKGGGIAVQVNQQTIHERAASTQHGALEQLQQVIGELLYDAEPEPEPTASPAIEGETLPPATPPEATE